MTNLSRRRSLGLIAGAVIPPAIVAGAAPTVHAESISPKVKVANALQNLKEAMQEAYGEWPEESGNVAHWSGSVIVLSVLKPEWKAVGKKAHWFIDDEGPLLADDVRKGDRS